MGYREPSPSSLELLFVDLTVRVALSENFRRIVRIGVRLLSPEDPEDDVHSGSEDEPCQE